MVPGAAVAASPPPPSLLSASAVSLVGLAASAMQEVAAGRCWSCASDAIFEGVTAPPASLLQCVLEHSVWSAKVRIGAKHPPPTSILAQPRRACRTSATQRHEKRSSGPILSMSCLIAGQFIGHDVPAQLP
ncbi:uncharacterized protein C8Q71DRAFT_726746 [Rhodofomes roseus]|uniref:Secreted protein n=1 Tax=Rhodofomes roseus TaxID=34475 RepID=A0ABQ8K3T1_9APHY|nr:uncharacterized protein C8Q71DRAFT_726746 [Rhodofomes roseus]KAH9831557.1 hypothetical protein C8Q71DRAFT_726746 [Rhodofomes roseus]